MNGDLWQVSAWRWTVAATVLLTGVVWLLSPGRMSPAATTAVATYTPPPASPPSRGVSAVVQGAPTVSTTSVARAAASPAQPAIASGSGFNPAFDAVLPRPGSSLPAGTELHLVGVYKGAEQEGQKEQPWWTKCQGVSGSADQMECHRKYAGRRTTRPIAVDVARTGVPIALALTAYEPVLWRVSLAPGVNLVKVYLGGYHGQDIAGLDPNIPVEVRTHEPSPCSNCLRQSGYFYAYSQTSPEYARAVKTLESITGLQPASFQGVHQSGRFSISRNLMAGNSGAVNPDGREQYVGKTFRNQVRLAGQTVPLPSGMWQGIDFAQGPGQRGSDLLLALARFDGSALKSVIAIRVQIANDANGFAMFQGCKTDPAHMRQVDDNESFGPQMCLEVVHATNTWRQDFLSSVASRLRAGRIEVPDAAMVGNFHKADAKRAIDMSILSLPDQQIVRGNETWHQSALHPKRIQPGSAQARFAEDHVRNSVFLYQLFKTH